MPSFLVMFAAVLVATSVAHADPSAATPEPEPSRYLQGGVVAGGNDGYLTAGGTIEGGGMIAPGVWLHASGTHGAATRIFTSGSGAINQIRVGADFISCHRSHVLCAFAGADLGYQRTRWTGSADGGWDNNNDTGVTVTYDRRRTIGVARIGLDVGGSHLRWRPSLESTVSDAGFNGFNLLQSVAYRF